MLEKNEQTILSDVYNWQSRKVNRRNSTAIITNVSFDDWTDYLGDPPMTMALLDRVVDQTNVIPFEGVSIREPKKKPE